MNLNKVKSRGLSTVVSVSVVSMVTSPSLCASALDFSGGYDEEKKVYYLISEGDREEFNSVLSFVFAFLRKIFAFDKKVKEEEMNKKNSDNISVLSDMSGDKVSVKEKLPPGNTADVYKSVKKLMGNLSEEYVLQSERYMPIEWDKNFKSNSGSYSCYFCTMNRYESNKRNLHVDTRVAKVTIDEEELIVDYTVGGLDKIVTVDFSEKDSLQKVTDLLESVRLHKQLLSGISDLGYKGAAIYNKEDGTIKVCSDNGEEWKVYADNYKEYCIVEEMSISKYSFVTLRYKDGKEVSYNLTDVNHSRELQNVFEHSYFVDVPKDNSYKIEYSNFTV